ncbi:MAG: IPExxxVDY family protein [Bacteroidales bacterium]|nr:IPExxxVDY family protein [Bacteroidales bacterium]
MATKKLILDSDNQEEISVIGIASTLAAYRLIHHLNKQLPSAFIKQPDLPYYLSEKETLLLPLYHYYHPTSKNNWFILANNTAGQKKAIPAFRNVDFFMLIDSVPETEDLDDITSRMRKAQGIQMAINIRPSTIKPGAAPQRSGDAPHGATKGEKSGCHLMAKKPPHCRLIPLVGNEPVFLWQ